MVTGSVQRVSMETSQSVLSKQMLAAMAFVLLCAASLLLANTVADERARMLSAMKTRADGVIWALEGATRSLFMTHRANSPIQRLVEEIAKQPNIAYLAVVAPDGRVLVHNEPNRVGRMVPDPQALAAFSGLTESRGYFVTMEDEPIYEVVKPFTPSISQGRHGGHMGRGMRQRWAEQFAGMTDQEFYVIVGIDPVMYQTAYREKILSTAVMAGLGALCGLTGLALFVLLRNYRTSSRMLRDARALTLQVFENLPIGVFTTDPNGVITLYNRHIADTFGLDPGRQALRLSDYPLLDWDALIEEIRDGKPMLEREMSLGRAGESGMPVSLSASPVVSEEGDVSGYLFIIRDLGEVKKLQSQIRLNERLSALGNLAAGVAHEVRNPLSSIKGYATFLASKFSEGEPAHRTGQMMIQEVERLNRVVSDLLNVAKLGVVAPQPQPLLPVLEHALRLIEPDAEAKGIAVEGPEPRELAETTLSLDADRFIQAMLNLLLNAVQATDPGGTVRLGLETHLERSGEHQMRISISDTGCGMTEDVIAGLFTPYFTTKASGTGLGLTIAHQIIEQHGGAISVHSRVGQGSVFTLSLPIV